MTEKPPRVFVSYSHDTPEHSARVLALADRLRAEGVDAWIDVYEAFPPKGWRVWMREQLREADWVICVGSPRYAVAAAGRGSGDVARGAGFEGTLIDGELYDAHGENRRFLPALFEEQGEGDLPDFLRKYRRFKLDREYHPLYALLTGQSAGAPPLGELRVLPAAVRGVGARSTEHTDPALLRYLRWTAAWFDALPTFDADEETALTDVYVGLTGAELGGHERHLLDDLVRRHPSQRWALQGDPGAGKSTLLRHLAVTLANEAAAAVEDGRDPGPASIPLLVNLAELGGGPLVDAVLDRILRDYARTERDAEEVRAALDHALRGTTALLLLDGLDEVDVGARDSLLAAVRGLSRGRQHRGLVITSRRFGYQRPDKRFREIEILPLTHADQRALLIRMLGEEHAERRLREIVGVASLQDLAANPFTLTLLGMLSRADAQPLPARRVAVYRRVLDVMLARSLSGVAPVDPVLTRQALQRLALKLVEGSAGPWTTEELSRHATVPVLETARATRTLVSLPDGTWRFAHRTLMECLAAERIVADGASTHAQALAGGVWWKPWTLRKPADIARWAEVYAMVAGLAPNPADRLRELRAVHPDLARSAAVGADGVGVEEVLQLWGVERPGQLVRELIQRIPERDACVAAILRLGARSREVAVYAAAGLLAIDRIEEIAVLRARYPGNIGVPERPWARIPAGGFWMGSAEGSGFADERPWCPVQITRPFRLLATPVTQALYEVVTGATPSHFQGNPRRPVETVTWEDAVAFCGRWAAVMAGGSGQDRGRPRSGPRLPREEEWEYACRAGTSTAYWSGNHEADLDRVGWYWGNSGGSTQPVAAKPPNPWGLYDMHGNVWEWTSSVWTSNSAEVPGSVDPREAPDTTDMPTGRVVRGGSCDVDPARARSACRVGNRPSFGVRSRGFRVLLPIPD